VDFDQIKPQPRLESARKRDDFVENEEHTVAISDLGQPPGIAGHRRDAAGGGVEHALGHESRDIFRSEAKNFRIEASM